MIFLIIKKSEYLTIIIIIIMAMPFFQPHIKCEHIIVIRNWTNKYKIYHAKDDEIFWGVKKPISSMPGLDQLFFTIYYTFISFHFDVLELVSLLVFMVPTIEINMEYHNGTSCKTSQKIPIEIKWNLVNLQPSCVDCELLMMWTICELTFDHELRQVIVLHCYRLGRHTMVPN